MKNLVLIGYRGTGKSVLGKQIAKKLSKEFVDTDKLIVKIAGKTIPEIFKEEGEEKFREIETEALKQAMEKTDSIISCGGGIIVKERNFKYLKKGIVCLLIADNQTIFNRIYKDENRPALTNKDPMEEIKHLLEVREPLYQKASDFEVDTVKNDINSCVNLIINDFEKLMI